jgi:hypothetical protein
MRNTVRIIGASLVSMAGLLLVPAIASAQALKTPIEGRWSFCNFLGEPEREWVDEDGLRHIRGQRGFCSHAGNVRGREDFVIGSDRESNGNVIFARGKNSFSGRILGEFVRATGHFTEECTRPEGGGFTCIVEVVWHLEDGRLLKFTVIELVTDPFPVLYTGYLLDPPGVGGANRNGPRRR